MDVQEALPSAGVLEADSLSLVQQPISREPVKRCSRTLAVDHGLFDSLKPVIKPITGFFIFAQRQSLHDFWFSREKISISFLH